MKYQPVGSNPSGTPVGNGDADSNGEDAAPRSSLHELSSSGSSGSEVGNGEAPYCEDACTRMSARQRYAYALWNCGQWYEENPRIFGMMISCTFLFSVLLITLGGVAMLAGAFFALGLTAVLVGICLLFVFLGTLCVGVTSTSEVPSAMWDGVGRKTSTDTNRETPNTLYDRQLSACSVY